MARSTSSRFIVVVRRSDGTLCAFGVYRSHKDALRDAETLDGEVVPLDPLAAVGGAEALWKAT